MEHISRDISHHLLTLLRAGIYDDASMLDRFPRLTPTQWEQIYTESKRQTVSGVICHALSFLPDELLPPYTLLLRWVARSHKIESSYARMSRTLISITTMMRDKGLHPVLLKGHSVARFYPRPELRVCGDIDLYFAPDERPLADDIIAASTDAKLYHAPDHSLCYRRDGIEIEHHRSFIQLYSPFHANAMQRIMSRETPVEISLLPGLETHILSPLAELLMINIHIMKHCFGPGIGYRHFCDYALAYDKLIPAIGPQRYADACKALKLTRWTDTLHLFINTYIPGPGPLPYIGSPARRAHVSRIMQTVTEGGNFGLHRSSATSTPGTLKRKLNTFYSFLRHSRLSLRIAPTEALWIIMRLARGQVRH